jgi:elongation factor G
MLLEAGFIHRMGSIEEKNTVSDYTELEKERRNSIFSTLMHASFRHGKADFNVTVRLSTYCSAGSRYGV